MNTTTTSVTPQRTKKPSNPFARGAIICGKRVEHWKADGPTTTQPLRWTRPRMIFVCAHGDLFHEAVPDEWIDRVFAVMALAPQHTFEVLTKRPERAREYFSHDDGFGRWGFIEHHARQIIDQLGKSQPKGKTLAHFGGSNMPHVWLGTSVSDQASADLRIPHLLATPAAVRFLSAEPLLAPVDLTEIPLVGRQWSGSALTGLDRQGTPVTTDCLHWVIVGGESGPGARPMHPDWARSLRDQCVAAGVAFFFKQWGEWGPGSVLMTTGESVFRQFRDYQHWVHKAPTWVNGGICLDADGRQLKIGGDFMRARDDGQFPVTITHRVGKRAAGRLLDGRTWDQMPGVRDG